jgi:hypothetical protein
MADESRLDRSLKLLSVVGAVVTFGWGVWVWQSNAEKDRVSAESEAAKHAESRRIEATKPFLDLQLKLYAEASQVTAKIATSEDAGEVTSATKRFWELYWGELALVENNEVATAMHDFSVEMAPPDHKAIDPVALRQASLKLAEKLRDSLAKSWDTDAWTDR